MRRIWWQLGEIGVARKEFRSDRSRKIDEGFVNRSLFCSKQSEVRRIDRERDIPISPSGRLALNMEIIFALSRR